MVNTWCRHFHEPEKSPSNPWLIPRIGAFESENGIKWGHNPYSTWGLTISSDDAWIEGPLAGSGSKTLSEGEQIVFGRSFEGDKTTKLYYELEQKISHVLDIHYISDRNAWCRLNQFGDIEEVAKITELKDLPNNESGIIITIKRDILGEYTSVSEFSLCRMFDFMRYKTSNFSGWGHGNEPVGFGNENDIFGKLVVVNGYGSYSRGIQVRNISVPKNEVINRIWGTSSLKKLNSTQRLLHMIGRTRELLKYPAILRA